MDIGVPADLSAIGAMSVAAAEVPANDKTLMAYLKGVITRLSLEHTPVLAEGSTSSSSYVNVVDISDTGVLTGISQSLGGAGADGYIKVWIDGTALQGDPVQFTPDGGGNSLAFHHRFFTSLRVQHKLDGAAVGVYTMVSYTVD